MIYAKLFEGKGNILFDSFGTHLFTITNSTHLHLTIEKATSKSKHDQDRSAASFLNDQLTLSISELIHFHVILEHIYTSTRFSNTIHPYAAHGLELLHDQLLLRIVGELVGEEQIAVIKRRQAVDVDLSSL